DVGMLTRGGKVVEAQTATSIQETNAAEGAVAGALAGGTVGVVTGALASFLIPGLGLVVTGGLVTLILGRTLGRARGGEPDRPLQRPRPVRGRGPLCREPVRSRPHHPGHPDAWPGRGGAPRAAATRGRRPGPGPGVARTRAVKGDGSK